MRGGDIEQTGRLTGRQPCLDGRSSGIKERGEDTASRFHIAERARFKTSELQAQYNAAAPAGIAAFVSLESVQSAA
jgi:hypothetical protein